VITLLGNSLGGWWVISNLIFSLVILAVLEFFLPEDKSNEHDRTGMIPDLILYTHFILQILVLSALMLSISRDRITGWQLVFAALSTGVHAGSSSIIVAHEMIHRKAALWQIPGRILLLSAGNIYFYIEHLRVHHKWVGTPKDAATARHGESVYTFFFRSVAGQIRSAWNLEKERLKQKGSFLFDPRNYVFFSVIVISLVLAMLYLFIGIVAVCVMAGQFMVANFLLEYTNYIEHYGLERKGVERVNAELSWQSDKVLSRFLLIDLSRHSDHHFYASKPYHILDSHKESPVLPAGYASCIYLAMIPSLWFRRIHPLLEEFQRRNES
jgi:alkane 1-monooxygenase